MWAAAALQIGSSLYSGFSGYKAKKKQEKKLKKIGKMRAAEYERQADLTLEQGIEQEKQVSDQLARRRSLIEGMYSKSGLLLTGTPATAMSEQRTADIENIENLRKDVSERAKSLRKAAQIERLQTGYGASALDKQATTSLIQGGIGAFSGVVDLYKWFSGRNPKQPASGTSVDYGWTQPQMNTISSYNQPQRFQLKW